MDDIRELIILVNTLNNIIPINSEDDRILKRLIKVEKKILSMGYDLSVEANTIDPIKEEG